MYAVKRKALTYAGYRECWDDDYRLSIEYDSDKEYYVNSINGVWKAPEGTDGILGLYLESAAAVADALEKCAYFDMPPQKVSEFLPDQSILPQELLRALMDDIGLGLSDAVETVFRSFGEKLLSAPSDSGLERFQPRTHALGAVLRAELEKCGLSLHDPYSGFFRSPLGAVREGTELTLRLLHFGSCESAELHVAADGFSELIPMRREGDSFICSFTPVTPAAYSYHFVCGGAETADFLLTVYRADFVTPEWFRQSVMYQIFPDRFGFSDDGTAERGIAYHRALGRPSKLHSDITEPVKWRAGDGEKDYMPDDFYGGTLRGIEKKLPYLRELGVSCIYLNPIVEARSNHRYDTADYKRVDPILGSIEDYVNLCRTASEMGIKIINDGVFSHTGADSVYFNKYSNYANLGAYNSADSEYYPWYDFRSFPDEYRSWWGFTELPEVNELNESWQSHIVTGDNSVVRHWLRLGASGWRLDVADELPDEVLALIRKAAREEKPDALILGEVWEDAVTKESYGVRRNYALGYSLDSVMNYPFRNAAVDFICGKSTSYELRDFLLYQKYNYPEPLYLSLMQLSGSHDVARLHTVLALGSDLKGTSREEQVNITLSEAQTALGTARQKLFAALQFCIPGVPCVYYGDEECLDGALDPFCRAPFEPSGKGLHNFYATLAEIRNTHKALRSGDMEISVPAPNVILVYRFDGSEKLACVLNNSYAEYHVPFCACPLLGEAHSDTLPPCSCEVYEFT